MAEEHYDDYFSTVTSDKIEVTIRNSGSVDARIATMYVTTPEGDKWKQDWTSNNVISRGLTKKFTFTTLHTVDGSIGAIVDEFEGVPFGWKTQSTYTIRVLTDNGFPSEAP